MILQSGINFRSFAEQKSFSFDLDVSLSSSSGLSAFGFSGDNYYYDFFKFYSGRIYDASNRFVHSYSKDDIINLSGSFSSGVLGYYINNKPAAMNLQVCDSTKSFNSVLLSTSSAYLSYDVDIFGGYVPSYSFSFSGQNILTGQNILGYIINNSSYDWQTFKVFSGNATFNYTGYKFQQPQNQLKISGGKSGIFSFGYSGDGSDYNISESTGISPLTYNINLYTNFGLINKTGNVNLGYTSSYFLDFYNETSGITNDADYYWNYLLEGKICQDSPFKFSIEKVSGFDYTHIINSGINVTGQISGLTTGFINGSGFLNGKLSGDLYSNVYDFYGNRVIGSGFIVQHSGNYEYLTGYIRGTGYRNLERISGGVFGEGFLNFKYNDVVKSTVPDYSNGLYLYSSGDYYETLTTGIISSKQTGEYYEYYVPGKYYSTNPSAPYYLITGAFSGNNVSNIQYSGNVTGYGAISSLNPALSYTGIFTGLLSGITPITGYFTSGLNYAGSLKTGVAVTGASSTLKYSNYAFSGGNSFYLNESTNSSFSGDFILKGLTGNFIFTPNTASGTSGINSFLTGSFLPVDTGNLSGYLPSFVKYPTGFINSWENGYSIYSDLSGNNKFDPYFQNVLGNPIYSNSSYLSKNSSLSGSYIQIMFSNGTAGTDFLCNSYCIAPHPQYPSPSSWSISGSNNGITWSLLDIKSGQNLEKNYLKVFDFNNSTFYKYLHFKINDTDNPIYHVPEVNNSEILQDIYVRGLAKFNFLNRIPVTYLSKIERSIPYIDYYSELKNNISVSAVSTDEWNYGKHRAFDSNLNSETWIYNANSTINSSNNRGVIINKNLENTGVITLNDISQAEEITEAAFNDFYNFYGGKFNTFMNQPRYNFAVTNKSNILSSNGPQSFPNKVQLIQVTGSRVVVSCSGETRFLSGEAGSLNTLNSSNLYTGNLFTAAEPYNVSDWKLGGTFASQFNVDRVTGFSRTIQNTNGKDYILNNGLIYTNTSGIYQTGFPIIRNGGLVTDAPTWESGVDSDGYSQLRYNLNNQSFGDSKMVGVSGIISHSLFIPELNKTKQVTYVYGDFTTSKFFRGRGPADDSSNQIINPQGRNIYCQRMASGRDSILNYEFPNSGIAGSSLIRTMQVNEPGGRLICMGAFSSVGSYTNKTNMVSYVLPTESGQVGISQDIRNEYNGFTGIGQSGFTTGGFLIRNTPVFSCDGGTIYSSCLSGASGLFIGGNFTTTSITGVQKTFNSERAVLLDISGNFGIGSIVTGYAVNGNVRAMDYDNSGCIHLGGEFTSASSSTRNKYARYNALTASLQSLDLNFDNTVLGLYCNRTSNILWAVGDFTSLEGGVVLRNRAAKINLTSNLIESWNIGDGFNNRVAGIVTGVAGDLIFYGSFTQFSGINCRNIAKFTSDGTFITGGANLYNYSDGQISTEMNGADLFSCTVDPVDKSIYLSCSSESSSYYGHIDGSSVSYNHRKIIRYNYVTLNPSGVAPDFIQGKIGAIKYWNDRIIVGGDRFLSSSQQGYGQFTRGIAAFINEPTGQLLTTFNPQLNGVIRSACKVSDGLILAGDFTYCNLVKRLGLAKVDFYGNIITGFNPNCENPDIIEIKNTSSGVFALTSKPWNSDTPGHFYKVDPTGGSILKNYSFNLTDSTYSNGDFFIDDSASAIGHVVISNIKDYNPSAFIEYTFPDEINSIQGYDIKFSSGLNPKSFSFMASGITGGNYQTFDYKSTPQLSGTDYYNYNINYSLSGIKKIKFKFDSDAKVGIRDIGIYTKFSGNTGNSMSLSLGHVRGTGFVTGSGVPVLYHVNNDYIYKYYPDSESEINSVYKVTGYLESGDFSRINIYGQYRASKALGSILITPDSGDAEVKKIKEYLVTGSKQSSIKLELKTGFNNYLTSNIDRFTLNTGDLNGFTQDSLIFYYNTGSDYNAGNSSHFDSIQTFISKLNTNFSNYFTGSFNGLTNLLQINSVGAVGHSGNMIYFKPVIKSGISNFLKNNNATSGFYFSGGETYFKDINTGTYILRSGVFSLGLSNPPIYIHKTEYKDFTSGNLNRYISSYNNGSFFTGNIGLGLSPINEYSTPFYATGVVNYDYSVRLTGLASGYNQATNSSGIVTGIINKIGTLSKDAVSGVAIWTGLYLTGTGSSGNVYVIPSGGSDYTEVSKYWINDFSGTFDFKITKTGQYSNFANSTASITSGLSWIDYDSNFKYNFTIKTGEYSTDSSVSYSPLALTYNSLSNSYYGSGVLKSTTCFPLIQNRSKYVKFEIDHYNPYNSGNNIIKYMISGSSGSYAFSGLIKE